jgi:hypothetical protein
VKAPALVKDTSPVGATAVGTLEALPTKISPDAKVIPMFGAAAVPELVIGAVTLTPLVTAGVTQLGFAAEPPLCNTCPEVPGAKADHVEDPRYNTLPCVLEIESRIGEIAVAVGAALEPEVLAKIVLLAMLARDSVPVVVIGPPVSPVPDDTLVTLPEFPDAQLKVPAPFVLKT